SVVGSSDDVNDHWEGLYNDGCPSRGRHIADSPDLAARLRNATTPTASDPTQYMVELCVFHQLHCLDLMRKLVYPGVFHLVNAPCTTLATATRPPSLLLSRAFAILFPGTPVHSTQVEDVERHLALCEAQAAFYRRSDEAEDDVYTWSTAMTSCGSRSSQHESSM
ncbi:Uncharacterized protein TPAR_03407, partial [Tolypocladium paradoxum]